MNAEIVFILELDTGRVTIESSQVDAIIAKQITLDLGQGSVVNCARPAVSGIKELEIGGEQFAVRKSSISIVDEQIYLFRLYHHSTVEGPGRRSVVQLAWCSIRCPSCYVPETHETANGILTPIDAIITEIDKKSGEHDGVSILGGEAFDQSESLEKLVAKLKAKNYHLTIYSGYMIEELLARENKSVNGILANTDLLIDGAFKREMAATAGEYRGSSNQRLISHPILRKTNESQATNFRNKNGTGNDYRM